MTILKSSTYSLGTKAIETILNLILLAILARLLEPQDFGIFAIVLALLQPLVDMGLTPAYVKAKNPTQDSFFTLGMFNMLILLILAPIISYIYEDEILMSLIIVFSLSVILSSISRQGYARDKKFDKLMLVSLIANIITFFIAIYFAYAGYGVWVLVIKAIVFNFMMTSLIFSTNRYKIVPWNKIKQFTIELKFGFQIFINRVLNGIFNASDKFIFGMELLGHYSNAQQIARMADTHIRMPITSAIYSHLERYSDKKNFYDKFASITFLITSLFSGLLILEGDVLLVYFLGEKWIFASEYIQPLGLFAMGIYTIISMSENSMKQQNLKVFGSLILLFTIIFLTCALEASVFFFVVSVSVVFFLYWGIALVKNSTAKIFFSAIVSLFLLITILFFFKSQFSNEKIELFTITIIYTLFMLSYSYYVRRKN